MLSARLEGTSYPSIQYVRQNSEVIETGSDALERKCTSRSVVGDAFESIERATDDQERLIFHETCLFRPHFTCSTQFGPIAMARKVRGI